MKQRLKQLGFTLIEIMVVVVIIGVFAGITSISLRTESPQRLLKTEGKRLTQVLRLALDEAQIQAVELGMLFNEQGYQFYTLQNRRWRPMANDKTYELHKWPEHITAQLTLEGFATFSDNPDNNMNKSFNDKLQREQLLEDESTDFAEEPSKTERERQKNASAKKPPQIFILSSGEITPFSLLLQFDHEGMDHPVYVEFKADYSGTIKQSETLDDRPLG